MKKDDFEPAKIISRPESKQNEQANQEGSTNSTEPAPVPLAEPAESEPSIEAEIDDSSYERILDRFTGKDISTGVWTSPYDMFQHGVFSNLYKSTIDQVAKNIKGIIIVTFFHAYLLIGYYLLSVYFDNDESQAFSKNPYKETSINDLAKRDDIPFSKQKLTDCIKTAAVDMELHKHGHHFDDVNYEHLLQIGRLKKQEERLRVAQMAALKKLTANELKAFINKMLGKTASQDKQIGRALIRQLREFVRLASDEDVQAFLADKDR